MPTFAFAHIRRPRFTPPERPPLLMSESDDVSCSPSPIDLYFRIEYDLVQLMPHFQRIARSITGSAQDGDDAAQDGALNALSSWRQYDPAIGSTRAWLTTIVYHAALHIVRARRNITLFEPDHPILVFNSADALTMTMRNLAAEELYAAIDGLPERQMASVIVRYFAGLSIRETATHLGLPEGTVKSHLHHARKALLVKLQEAPIVMCEPHRRPKCPIKETLPTGF